jgi:hypothetical protein
VIDALFSRISAICLSRRRPCAWASTATRRRALPRLDRQPIAVQPTAATCRASSDARRCHQSTSSPGKDAAPVEAMPDARSRRRTEDVLRRLRADFRAIASRRSPSSTPAVLPGVAPRAPDAFRRGPRRLRAVAAMTAADAPSAMRSLRTVRARIA